MPYRGLSDKQLAFVDSYVANGASRESAARDAGYAETRTEGTRLLALPHIRAAIRERLEIAIETEGANIAWGLIKSAMQDTSWPKHIRANLAMFTIKTAGYERKVTDLHDAKPLDEMTTDELANVIARGEAALATLQPAKVTEIQASTLPALEPA